MPAHMLAQQTTESTIFPRQSTEATTLPKQGTDTTIFPRQTTETTTLPKQVTDTTLERAIRVPRPVQQASYQAMKQTAPKNVKPVIEAEPQYHSFVYDSGNETTKIQIKLPVEPR